MLQSRSSAAILLALGTIRCLSASTFTVNVGGVITSAQTPVGAVANNGHGEDAAFSGNGSLRGRSFVGLGAPNALVNDIANSGVTASSVIDDITIVGPAPFVPGSISLFFDGLFTQQIDNLRSGTLQSLSGAGGSIALGGSLSCINNCGLGIMLNSALDLNVDTANGPVVSREQGGTHNLQVVDTVAIPIGASFIGSVWAGEDTTVFWGLTGRFESGPVLFPTNTPLVLTMNMTVSEVAVAQLISGAFSGVNAFNTFGLPRGVPVFDLPQGFTANAPSIGLVDNVIPLQEAGVPEPATMGLAAAGVALFWLRYRRQSHEGPRNSA